MPSKEPAPVDPIFPSLQHAYRLALTEADAYGAVRRAVRVEEGTLRIGNRFTPIGKYREIAFVAVGAAAGSMAMAVENSLGPRITQGLLAGPKEVETVPFHSFPVPAGRFGSPESSRAVLAIDELVSALGPEDLLIVLLSAGSLGALTGAPAGVDGAELDALVHELMEANLPGAEISRVLRSAGAGLVGGGLATAARAGSIATLVVDRGDGGELVGGGPTLPLRESERRAVRAALVERGAWVRLAPAFRQRIDRTSSESPSARPGLDRPVVIAAPADALRGASDALADRRWTCRLGGLSMRDTPAALAAALLERVEAARTELGSAPRTGEYGRAGAAVLAGVTFDLPEGVSERHARDAFFAAIAERRHRREIAVAFLPTSGGTEHANGPGWLVLGDSQGTSGSPEGRPLGAPEGVTDVGSLAILFAPNERTART
ncbi:MAG: DUF4147 domain-containing protein [Thermoplasmata archaeon]|nr:DUF4147 domain-containing protein [Thermoplasmata archaeon]